jgi:DNA polymerase-3 subunit gamma/tau
MADQRYLVAARKYRPALFKDVVAQEHVTDTLKNALRLDRLAHAYLFSGPRGVGKTTTARILAKAINCETPRDEREDGAEPCCECDSCLAFEDGRSLNVFEMDAASNNKVDDIRELREKVRIPPQGSTKKVYILDEVHMLSKQAFNALLKTLEEPPAHALFIFATTEPHKVLATILSRCQRFDFRRIPVPDMVDRLRDICAAEDIEADEESLMLLARKGDGALRDALSAFDQAISLCGTTLEYGDLTQALGVVDQDLYFRLTDHVAEQSTAGVLKLVHHVVRSGYDLQEFLAGLAEHLRNLLVARSLDGSALEDVAETTQSRYATEAQRFREADLLRLLSLAGDAEDAVKSSTQPRLKLEMTLLKMAKMRRSADLRQVLQKINRLEQMVEEGELPAHLPTDGAPASPDAQERSTEERSTEDVPPDASAAPASSGATAEPSGTYASDPSARRPDAQDAETAATPPSAGNASGDASGADVPPADESGEREASREKEANDDEDAAPVPPFDDGPTRSSTGPSEPEASDEDDPSSTDTDSDSDSDDEPPSDVQYGDLFGQPALDASPSEDASSRTDAAASRPDRASGDGVSDDGASDGSVTMAAGGTATAQVDAPATGAAIAPVTQAWPELVRTLKQERIRVGTFLEEAEPVERSGDTVVVAVPDALHRDQLRDVQPLLVERLTALVDASIDRLRFEIRAPDDTEDNTAPDTLPTSPRERLDSLRDSYEALDVLFNQFGAEMAW